MPGVRSGDPTEFEIAELVQKKVSKIIGSRSNRRIEG